MELTEREEVKQANPLAQVVRSYGIKVDSRNKCLCPFHNDKNASMQIFRDNKFKCWACGEYGDVFDFVMKYNRCDFKTAFALLGGVDKKLTPAEKTEIFRYRKEQERLEKLRRDYELDMHEFNLKLNTCYRFAIWLGRDVEDFSDEQWELLSEMEDYRMNLYIAMERRKELYDRNRKNDTTRAAIR